MKEINCNLKKNKEKKYCLKKHMKHFPVIMYHPRMKIISVIYSKRVADFKLDRVDTFKELKKSPYDEVQTLKDSGFKMIRESESIIWSDKWSDVE